MNILVVEPSQIPEEMYGKIAGLDIETSNLNLKTDICLLSTYVPENENIYVIPLKCKYKGVPYEINDKELSILKNYIESIEAVGHNLQFDGSRLLFNKGISLKPYMDTFLLARIFQVKKQGLKDMVKEIRPDLKDIINKFDDVVDTKQENIDYDLDDRDILIYSALDAVLPFLIISYYKEKIEENQFTVDLENNFLNIVIDINKNGLKIDLDIFNDITDTLKNNKDLLKKEIDAKVGFDFRPSATADFIKIMESNQIQPTLLTPKGKPSTSEEAVTQMIVNELDEGNLDKVDLLEKIMQLKKSNSVINYCEKIPKFIIDNYLHFNVEQLGFDASSRVYTKEASVTQLPRMTREAIVPEKGKKFVYFDWNSAELYIAASWSDCKKIKQWYAEDIDIHTELAKMLLCKDEITLSDRETAKTCTFASMYGSEGDSVAIKLNISTNEADKLIEEYNNLMPEIGYLRDKIIKFTEKNGYTTTIFDRKRYILNINSDKDQERKSAQRQAFNSSIQSSCADFFKLLAVKTLKYPNIKFKFGVFDSFLLEVPEDMSKEDIVKIVDDLSDFSDYFKDFKFKYKIGIGYNWKEAYDNVD